MTPLLRRLVCGLALLCIGANAAGVMSREVRFRDTDTLEFNSYATTPTNHRATISYPKLVCKGVHCHTQPLTAFCENQQYLRGDLPHWKCWANGFQMADDFNVICEAWRKGDPSSYNYDSCTLEYSLTESYQEAALKNFAGTSDIIDETVTTTTTTTTISNSSASVAEGVGLLILFCILVVVVLYVFCGFPTAHSSYIEYRHPHREPVYEAYNPPPPQPVYVRATPPPTPIYVAAQHPPPPQVIIASAPPPPRQTVVTSTTTTTRRQPTAAAGVTTRSRARRDDGSASVDRSTTRVAEGGRTIMR